MALAPAQPYVGNNAATQIFGSQYGPKPAAPSMGTTVTPPAPQTTNQKVAAQKPLVRTLQPNLATNAGAVSTLKQQNPTTAASFGTSQAPAVGAAPAVNPLVQPQNVQPGGQPPAQAPAPVGSNNVPAPVAQAQGTPFAQQVGAEQQAGAGSTATTQRITDLGTQIAQLQQDEAQQLAALGMGGGDLGPTTGEQAAVQSNYAARIASLTQEQQTQQAQQMAQFGQQTAAAQQLAPQLTSPGQAVFNPTQQPTGGIVGGGSSLNPIANIPSLAAAVASGQISYSQALQQGGTVASFPGALTAAILQANPTFNFNAQQGSAAGQQQSATILGTANAQASATNTQTALTTAQSAAAAAYSAGYPQYTNLTQNVLPNIADFGTLLTQAAGGVNPFSSTWANQTWGSFQKALLSGSDGAAQWSKFQSTFQQLQNSIAQLAQAGGAQTPTANTAQSQLTLDPNASISTIQNVLSRVQQEAAIYGTNMANAVNANLAQAQGGTPTSSSGGATPITSNSVSGSYTQNAQGQWVYIQ